MAETEFTLLVGCKAPIQSVPVPGIATPEFVAAVCNAGGLGMLSGAMATPETVSADLDQLDAATSAPYGVNFLMPFVEAAPHVEAAAQLIDIAARRARVVEFFYGEPDVALVKRVHAGGALCSWQVGSAREAEAAAGVGCDFVIIQGIEAGGHVRGTTGLLPVLGATLARVDIPVLAAGGIATGRDVAALLRAGAAGCRVGTRFVCTTEANAHEEYKQALVNADAEDTAYTLAFSVMWPDAPHRVLQSAVDAARDCSEDVVGEVEIGGRIMRIDRGSVIAPTRETKGKIEAMRRTPGVMTVAQVMSELLNPGD